MTTKTKTAKTPHNRYPERSDGWKLSRAEEAVWNGIYNHNVPANVWAYGRYSASGYPTAVMFRATTYREAWKYIAGLLSMAGIRARSSGAGGGRGGGASECVRGWRRGARSQG